MGSIPYISPLLDVIIPGVSDEEVIKQAKTQNNKHVGGRVTSAKTRYNSVKRYKVSSVTSPSNQKKTNAK